LIVMNSFTQMMNSLMNSLMNSFMGFLGSFSILMNSSNTYKKKMFSEKSKQEHSLGKCFAFSPKLFELFIIRFKSSFQTVHQLFGGGVWC